MEANPAQLERAEAVSRMAWPELRAAVAGCEACGLSRSRQRTVFGTGHESAHWMVVGEAPGEQEDAEGEPFVGAAGQLLDRMLQAVGQGRQTGGPEQQVFIANTLKCRPPGNRNPAPNELSCCAPFLRRQIALVRPRVILAMGRFAVGQTLGLDEPIGRLRGRVHDAGGIPVVVTFHPSYLLRQPTEKAKAWEDLCLAASVASESARVG
jgi:DNA polymerase